MRERNIIVAAFAVAFGIVFAIAASGQIGPPIGGGGGGGGTPCTTTANSLQYDNAGAFGCATQFLYNSAKAGIGDGANWLLYWSAGNVDLEWRNSADSSYIAMQTGLLSVNGNVSAATGREIAVGNIFGASTAPVQMVPDGTVIGAGILGFLGCSTCLHSWSASATNAATPDTAMGRNAAGVVEVDNGTLGTYREIAARSHVVKGTVPGISGCTAGTQTGGNTAGTYSSGTSGTCTVVLTFGFTAPTGWSCATNNQTTAADQQHQSASSTTTATITGTTVSGDVINFHCMAY